ncbi:MAG TPA: amino acid adenylation domain-containing protein [Streptomyces sp.]
MKGQNIDAVLPLTPLQEGFLFHSLYDGEADVYLLQTMFELDGPLDEANLRNAARTLLTRHPNLRAGFRQLTSGRTVQVIPSEAEPAWHHVDLTGRPERAQEAELAELVDADRVQPFDIAEPPLVRLTLVRLGAERHVLLLTAHHILWDGWSEPLVFQELFDLYARATEPPRVRPFSDYLAWLARQDREAALDTWREALAELDGPTLVAPAVERRAQMPQRVRAELTESQTTALADTARSRGLTLNTVVQGAWALLLGMLTDRQDVVFGATVAGRPAELPGVESMVGLFINTLPVRVRTAPGDTLAGLLSRLQDEQAALTPYQYVGLSDIQHDAGLGELFDTTMVFQNLPDTSQGFVSCAASGLRVTKTAGQDATHYPLNLVAVPGERLLLEVSYRADHCDRDAAEGLLERLRRVFEVFSVRPDVPLAGLELLSAAERELVVERWNDTVRPVPVGTVSEAFEGQAVRTPDAVALVSGEGSWTYAEVNARANRLARHLAGLGVGPESGVGVLMQRSPGLVIALLAILKAGGHYVPLDSRYPLARRQMILADTRCQILLTDEALASEAEETGLPVTVVDEALLAEGDASDLEVAGDAQQLAYVMFTSGSTGRPKGVAVTHHGVRALIADRRFDAEAYRTVLLQAPHSFDASTAEIWVPLLHGGTLVVAPDGLPSSDQIQALVTEHGITAVFPPSGLFRMLAEEKPDTFAGVRAILTGGDTVSPAAVDRILQTHPGVEVVTSYGPTETTMLATTQSIGRDTLDQGGALPIGAPMDNTQLYILDAFLRPVPPGVRGELYIAGAGVARGYQHQPGLTAGRFVACPYGPPGTRMYRTGDLASHRTDTPTLDFHGRTDHQTKIRGFRIEPAEIETTLTLHPHITEALITLHETTPGTRHLTAYITTTQPLTPDQVREHTAQHLPAYMVPTTVITLDTLPLTPNGKIDHAALPTPDFTTTSSRQPRTPTEETLAAIFRDVLARDSVGIDDSFFDLGGDSITSIQLVARARTTGLHLTPRDIFQHKTIAQLAANARSVDLVAAEAPDAGLGLVPATPTTEGQRLHAPDHLTTFAQSVLVHTPAGLRAGDLTVSVQALLDTHDALRARLVVDEEGRWALHVSPPGTVRADTCLHRVDIGHDDPARLTESVAEEGVSARQGLDPETGRLVRVVWFDAGPERAGRLLIVVHHLVVDGVSWRILLADLASAYEAAVQGREPVLGPAATSLRTWARLLRQEAVTSSRTAELPLWVSMAEEGSGHGVAPGLLLDPRRDTLAASRSLTLTLPADVTRAVLTSVPAAFHAEVNDVLLTALALAVNEWRHRRGSVVEGSGTGVLVGLEGHGREQISDTVDLSRTVGWFTTRYPVRLDPGLVVWGDLRASDPAVGQALKAVKEQLRAIPDHGIGYGLLRHLNPDTAPVLAGLPEPQIGFNYLGRFTAPDAHDTVAWSHAPEDDILGGGADPGTPMAHPVQVSAVTQDGADGPRLTATWSWAPALLAEEEVDGVAHAWFRALRLLVEHCAATDAGGHTPSDFLLALSQEEIELLEQEWDAGL